MSREPIDAIGILVGQSDYRDADRIVRLLTPDHGLISALARSARASRRRFGGALDFGNKLQAILRPGRGDLWSLQEVTLLEGRAGAHADLNRLTLMAYACQALAALSRTDSPEPRLFGLLEMACLLIEVAEQSPAAMFRLALEAKALTFAGMTPGLRRCVACTAPLAAGPGGPWAFAPSRGGALHDACDVDGGRPVSLRWLERVEAARRTPLKDLLDVSVPAGPGWVLAETIEHYAGGPIRSRSVLASLNPHA